MVGAFLFVKNLLFLTLGALVTSLQHNWKVLLFAIVLAVLLKTYVNSDKLSQLLFRKKKISVIASVLFGAFTPLCACGTTAVLIGMLTTTLPWSPIMAFLTSSPLMSPDGFVLITGVIGLKFAIALTVASIIIGLSSGFITNMIEKNTHFFDHQSRFEAKDNLSKCNCKNQRISSECSCNSETITEVCACDEMGVEKEYSSDIIADHNQCICNSVEEQRKEFNESVHIIDTEHNCCYKNEALTSKFMKRYKIKQLVLEIYHLGIKQILIFYSIFICIGFLINYFVPASIISILFGANTLYAVPLASLIGLPLYITTDSGIPMIHSMMQSGASQGAMLAFMITGSATSAWVIAGLTSFMKKRAIALYVTFVLVGGIVSGYLLDFINLFL